MAARTKAQAVALRDGASDSEDDLATAAAEYKHTPTGVENKRNTSKTAKSKAATQRAGVTKTTTTKRKAPSKESRPALKDRTNVQDEHAEDDMDNQQDDTRPKAKRAKTATAAKPAGSKRGRPTKRAPSPDPQPDSRAAAADVEDVEKSIEIDDNADAIHVSAPLQTQRQHPRPTPAPLPPLQPQIGVRAGSVQPGYPPSRERSGSINGVERRGGDPELRRQYNELTKNYENLKLKLESLQEVGKNQAETNFEKLKRASDQRAKDANDVIASLRRELAELRKANSSTSSESASLQKQISTLTAANERLTAERDSLEPQLTVAQNEVKSLEAKLTATRQQLSASAKEARDREAAAAAAAAASSTAAHHHGKAATAAANRSAAAEATLKEKEAQMVQNLYSDLTGLVVLGVKRKEGEDEFDCLQTGRNGTLHFHLSIANDPTAPHPRTPSGMSYEEAEFAYEPLLDGARDRDLLTLLPDYLTEDICFPRAHAQKFYAKVVDSITRNVVLDDDGEEEDEE